MKFTGSAAPQQRRRLALTADIEVHERHGQLGQLELPAQQRAVDLGLRPVEVQVVRRDQVEVALRKLCINRPRTC